MIEATTVRLLVNGLEQAVSVDTHLIDDILVPQLGALARKGDSARSFAFLTAPPGVGKSTLAALVEQRRGQLDLDTIGMDSFHYPNAYLATHHLPGDHPTSLSSIKGAPETFDVAELKRHLVASAARELVWPVYDRTLHDVVAAGKTIAAKVVLLEGNWLLLDEPRWRELSDYSALNIFIDADPDQLKERLIERKMRGGMDHLCAAKFYETSDRPNIDRVLQNTDRRKVDLALQLKTDGTIDLGESQ